MYAQIPFSCTIKWENDIKYLRKKLHALFVYLILLKWDSEVQHQVSCSGSVGTMISRFVWRRKAQTESYLYTVIFKYQKWPRNSLTVCQMGCNVGHNDVEILNSPFTIQIIVPAFLSTPTTNPYQIMWKGKTENHKGKKKKTTENITQSLLAQSWNFFFHPYVSRGVFSVLLQSVREKSHENLAPSKSTPQLHAPKSSETFYTRSIELQLHFREYIAKVGNIIMYQKALLQTWMWII